MIPELGHFALILALCVALVQAILPLAGSYTRNPAWLALARPAAGLQFGLLVLAFGCLATSFLSNDFSVAYVAQHSNSMLPKPYQFAAVWGGHEGSLLLWIVLLSAWGGAVALFSRNLPLPMVARVLSVMGWVAMGFLAFIISSADFISWFSPGFPAAAFFIVCSMFCRLASICLAAWPTARTFSPRPLGSLVTATTQIGRAHV